VSSIARMPREVITNPPCYHRLLINFVTARPIFDGNSALIMMPAALESRGLVRVWCCIVVQSPEIPMTLAVAIGGITKLAWAKPAARRPPVLDIKGSAQWCGALGKQRSRSVFVRILRPRIDRSDRQPDHLHDH